MQISSATLSSTRSETFKHEERAFTLVMMLPHTPVRRDWAARVAEEEVGVRVLQPETMAEAIRDIADANAAFGTIPPEVLAAARRLRCCRRRRLLHLQASTIPS